MISLFILLCFTVFTNSCNIGKMYLYLVWNKDPLLLLLYYNPLTKRFIVQKQSYWRSRMTINITCKHVTFLVLIDLNVVHGSVDQNILLAWLKSSIGTCCINATALNWFTSYHNNRSQRLPTTTTTSFI